MRTFPNPNDYSKEWSLEALVTVVAAVTFNQTLSGTKKPYMGVYYRNDRSAVAQLWCSVGKTGTIATSGLNGQRISDTLASAMGVPDVVFDNRWSCAGLTEVLFHVGRAIVALSALWYDHNMPDEESERGAYMAQQEINYLGPTHVRSRVVDDLSFTLGIGSDVVDTLLGPPTCPLLTQDIFPSMTWCRRDDKNAWAFERPAQLWAVYELTSRVAKEKTPSPAVSTKRTETATEPTAAIRKRKRKSNASSSGGSSA